MDGKYLAYFTTSDENYVHVTNKIYLIVLFPLTMFTFFILRILKKYHIDHIVGIINSCLYFNIFTLTTLSIYYLFNVSLNSAR